ncbi:glutamate-1-semialdehyde-2,1-aminomutase [Lachnoclostridium sp. An196]|uniref:glutamate-1-semialdehyde 2,1-aminomutase n=1 Tax=Lachnoclostridium sp. An196 TaxID=1965583 RepID=UPI000B3704BA|nr:glutamate-1-semialdehyde 2,1-aminomutase [Lachnoclostridium sp. An196]OUP19881.1 glutamate-1-semialdehyde-2,1-aminomutase [Lachnoclostridium sp. An196]
MGRSEELFEEAVNLIPGGVNSPVRAFGSVGMTPRFIASAEGAYMTDADGKRYLDYVGSWGPMILGHANPMVLEKVMEACRRGLSFGAATEAEVDMARLICSMVPSVEMVRMVNSGTEAVMSAVRAARGYTGRNKIIKFEGCYHGHSDAMLVKAGSGVMTAGVPDSSGVPAGCTEDTLLAVYNDLDSVKDLFDAWDGQIAALIVEPVGANMGVVPPAPGFLEGLRKLCTEHGAVLIFDEVITGFRLARGGAQEYYGIQADLTTYGKIIGGGMPVGAYGGRREIMEVVSPVGKVYQAGTLSGNPVAMAAGLAQLTYLNEHPEIYKDLERKGELLYGGMENLCREHNLPYQVNHVSSLGCLFFSADPVTDYASAKKSDTKAFTEYFRQMLESGIYIAPSQFEAMFLSAAHTDEELEFTLEKMAQILLTK